MPATKPAAKAKTKVKSSNCADAAIASKRKPSVEAAESAPVMDARSNMDRRDNDRRKTESSVEVDRRSTERRVKVSRRRQIDPTTCERDYLPEEIEFMSALDDYKRRSGRMFPTCSEILEVFKGLGYEKHVELPTIAPATVLETIPTTSNEQAV